MMRAGWFLLGAIAAAWIAYPALVHLVRDRMTRSGDTPPLSPRARRWVSRGMITAGSAVAGGGAALLQAPIAVSVTLTAAGVIAWWLVCIDAAIHRLPDPLVAALGAVFITGYSMEILVGAAQPQDLGRALVAGAAWGAVFGLLALARPRAMGLGDVKLAAALGIGVGWFGWAPTAQWVVVSFILGGVFALSALATRRVSPTDTIAFGPWLIIGAAVAIGMAGAPGVSH